MNQKRISPGERRLQLVAQITAQRALLALEMEPMRAHLALADKGVAVVRYIRQHPVITLGGGLFLALMRTRGAGKWLQRGWLFWQMGRRLRKR